MMTITDTLITPEMHKPLIGLLADNDPEVRAGALNTLAFVGRFVRGASPTILKIAREDPNIDVRKIAFAALGLIADESLLPELKELSKTVPAGQGLEELKSSIAILRSY